MPRKDDDKVVKPVFDKGTEPGDRNDPDAPEPGTPDDPNVNTDPHPQPENDRMDMEGTEHERTQRR